MLQKLNTHHKRSKLFISPVNSTSALFGIRHFAGTVYYSAKGKQHLIYMKKRFDFQGKEKANEFYKAPNSLNGLRYDNIVFKELQLPECSIRQKLGFKDRKPLPS